MRIMNLKAEEQRLEEKYKELFTFCTALSKRNASSILFRYELHRKEIMAKDAIMRNKLKTLYHTVLRALKGKYNPEFEHTVLQTVLVDLYEIIEDGKKLHDMTKMALTAKYGRGNKDSKSLDQIDPEEDDYDTE